MSKPEYTTCGLEEYRNGEAGRVREGKLSLNGLYTVFFALEPQISRGEAVKCPGQVIDISTHDNGVFHIVKSNLLDSSGKPALHRDDPFYEGYLLAEGARNEFANIGYFREEDENPASQEVPTKASVDEGVISIVSESERIAA